MVNLKSRELPGVMFRVGPAENTPADSCVAGGETEVMFTPAAAKKRMHWMASLPVLSTVKT